MSEGQHAGRPQWLVRGNPGHDGHALTFRLSQLVDTASLVILAG